MWCPSPSRGFWDVGTTTVSQRSERPPRQSRWTWPKCVPGRFTFFFGLWNVDWVDQDRRRRSECMVGITVDRLNIATGVLLNVRVVLTAANPLEPFLHRVEELRVWALGRSGMSVTPWRYRVWRVRRLLPRSWRSEHQHGPRGRHSPRHDLAVVHTLDQMYYNKNSRSVMYRYPYRARLVGKRDEYDEEILLYGSSFLSLEQIRHNYEILYALYSKKDFVNCEKYIPKWWGKFVCLRDLHGHASTPSGGALVVGEKLYAIGCFMINYNQERIHVFTDLRYYYDRLQMIANFTPGEYYEYAYPEWGVKWTLAGASWSNVPAIPEWQIDLDLALGK